MASDQNTSLHVETIFVDSTGLFRIGSSSLPVQADKTAEVVFEAPVSPIDLAWDPEQRSRGMFALGPVYIFGSPKTYMSEVHSDAFSGDSTLDLGLPVPADWLSGDEIVLTGTHFERFTTLRDEKATVMGVAGSVVSLQGALSFDHLRVDPQKPLHIAHLTRNVTIRSASMVTQQRGHLLFRHPDVQLNFARFLDLGRTDKSIPLDEISISSEPTGAPLCDQVPVIQPRPLTQINNRRGRYAVHFHQIGVTPGSPPPTNVLGCVVDGTIGWGFVNHSSHVDFRQNVCYDFAGAGFVTESGDELGNFHDNIAVHGTGVPGEYFNIQIVFKNSLRPQPLSDFAFGGDGFWFQGPAVSARSNIANSCNGAGMIWFTSGSVNIANGEYIGFTPSTVNTIYAGHPDIANLQYRTWNHDGSAVIADLPILEMDGFTGYACLVGFRLRMCNQDSEEFFQECPYEYNLRYQGTSNNVRQTVENINVWNNEQGFRARYLDATDWINVDAVNRLRPWKDQHPFAGAEFRFRVFSQTFTDLTIDGYAVAGWTRNDEEDNSAQITFTNGPNYLNYANEDTYIGWCAPRDFVVTQVTSNTPTSATVHWTYPDAERFFLRYRQTDAAYWHFATQTDGTQKTWVVDNLLMGASYELQVIASCSDGTSKWTPTFVFAN